MKKLTAEWVRKAEADRVVADRSFRVKPAVTDSTCFHCQQMAEKYLKALLCEHGLPVPKTHNLVDLLNRLLPVEATLERFRLRLRRLLRYAVDYRYPGIHASTRQAQSALRIATEVQSEIRGRLGLRARRKDS